MGIPAEGLSREGLPQWLLTRLAAAAFSSGDWCPKPKGYARSADAYTIFPTSSPDTLRRRQTSQHQTTKLFVRKESPVICSEPSQSSKGDHRVIRRIKFGALHYSSLSSNATKITRQHGPSPFLCVHSNPRQSPEQSRLHRGTPG